MKKRSNVTIMARLLKLVSPLAGIMCLAVFLGLLGNLAAAMITVFGGKAALTVLGFETGHTRGTWFAWILLLALCRGLLRYGEQASNHFIAFKLLALIRDRVFKALRRLSPAKLEGRDRGDLISVITGDIELLEVFYAHTISPAAIWLLFTVVMLVYIGKISVKLCIPALLGYITVGLIQPALASKISKDTGMRVRTKTGELASYVLDNLRGLFEVIQFGIFEERLQGMQKKTAELQEGQSELKKASGINAGIAGLWIYLFDLFMLYCAASLYLKGEIAFDGLLTAQLAMMSSFGPSSALAALGTTLQSTFAAGDRILDILDEKPVTEDVSGEEKTFFGGAEADHVSFAYEEETILDDLSLKVYPGTILGISGKSGSGKSTLLKLFMRFWDVQSGTIRISHRDIRHVNTTDLRSMEGYLTQETHLFHDTIRNNLKIAKLDATDEEIVDACKKASLHEWIMTLPKGYDTEVGELGSTLSGGERQRMGLARIFLHDASFVLLDEPTSSLDSLNEAVILKTLKDERQDKTIILVSHRDSTLHIADEIYRMSELRNS